MKIFLVGGLVTIAVVFLLRRSYRLFTGKESSCSCSEGSCSCSEGTCCGDNCTCKDLKK